MKMKSKTVGKLVISLCFFFGLAMAPLVRAGSDPGYPIHRFGTLPYQPILGAGWFIFVDSLGFDQGKEVHITLTLTDPVEGTDPDIYVTTPSVDGFVWVGGAAPTGSPVAEDGYFYAPVTDAYTIWLYNYYIPDPLGTAYDLMVDVGDDLVPPYDPLESNGLTVGELTSYLNNHENAKARASEHAAFRKVPSVYAAAIIGSQTLPFTAYTLPAARYCESDPLAVGGFVWFMPAEYFGSLKEAKDMMLGADYEFSIDGMPLSELTSVSDEKFKPYYHGGERIGYMIYSSTGIFRPGELAELIGTGPHTLYSEITFHGWPVFYNYQTFFLLPEGSTSV